MNVTPTLPILCGLLPPEGAAAPAAWQSQIRGPYLNDSSLQPDKLTYLGGLSI